MQIARLLTIVLTLNFLFSGVVLARNYPDVPPSHKHSEAITALTSQQIVKGYGNGEFHPEGLINRAEAVKVLVKSQFNDTTISQSLNWHKELNHRYVVFPDVKMGEWFGKYIETAYQNKIVSGYPDGTFKPANHINFAEALKIILETNNVDLNTTPYRSNSLLHIKRGDWFEPYFTYAYEHNLINQNKFYHPAQLITRGEFVEIIYRLQTVQKTGLSEFIVSKTPTSHEYTITIPRLNIINLNVSFANIQNEPAALSVLKNGLGHYLSPPDSGKKIVIFGHSSGYSWDNTNYKTVLREINKIQNGDRIYINYKEKGYVYEVFNQNIIPASEDKKIIANQNKNELTLYTCWPPDSISYRYVIYSKPVT